MTDGSPREQTAGSLVGLKEKVRFKKTSCGSNGLVALKLGCDYGDSSSISIMTKSMFEIRVPEIQSRKNSGSRAPAMASEPGCTVLIHVAEDA